MKKVAVLQSNYIPWKGYFDIIHDVDLFIFHDDLQYTKMIGEIETKYILKWSFMAFYDLLEPMSIDLFLDVEMNEKSGKKSILIKLS